MFCNKHSSVPVCCESLSIMSEKKIQIENTENFDNKKIPKNQDLNQQILQNQNSDQKTYNIIEKTNFTLKKVVNRDMNINGECTINSALVMNDEGIPITCDLNKKCPLVFFLYF